MLLGKPFFEIRVLYRTDTTKKFMSTIKCKKVFYNVFLEFMNGFHKKMI